jgi:hypothetical protein
MADLQYTGKLLMHSAVIALGVLLVDEILLRSRIKQNIPYRDTLLMRGVVLMLEIAFGILLSRQVIMY